MQRNVSGIAKARNTWNFLINFFGLISFFVFFGPEEYIGKYRHEHGKVRTLNSLPKYLDQ